MKILILIISNLYAFNLFSSEYKFNITKFRKLLKKPIPNLEVSYQNHLGEGEGYFNPLPRYNPNKVNCTTWWQQLLAESFTDNNHDLIYILDQIRYFGGTPGYGMRKHFIDHHLLNDPNPLRPITVSDNINCEEKSFHQVELDIDMFKKSTRYSCPIAYEDNQKISFNYLSPKKAIDCMASLNDGIYLAFPVASERYLKIWGKKSGPMGLVHGLIIDKENKASTLYHASIDRRRVASESFSSYVLAPGSRLFKGYRFYKIDQSFSPSMHEVKNKVEIISCEKNLVKKYFSKN